MNEHDHEMMVESIREKREDRGQQPTQYRVPENKILCCYAIASLRKKVSSEHVGSVMAVLLWLVKHANPSSGRCDPGLNKLALETGYGRRTIIRALETAEDIGYLIKEGRDGRTSAYHLNFRDMIADFLEIEEEAKRGNEERHTNPPMPRVAPPHATGGTGTHATAGTLKHKGESGKGNAYPKGVHSPSANSTTPVESKKRFSGKPTVHSANPTFSETAARQRVAACLAADPFVRNNPPPFEAVERAVVAELNEEGSGRSIINKAANDTWRARRSA
jgi:hypothetical protein